MVELYWQGKTEVFVEKPVSVANHKFYIGRFQQNLAENTVHTYHKDKSKNAV